jgi:hypothetical protein
VGWNSALAGRVVGEAMINRGIGSMTDDGNEKRSPHAGHNDFRADGRRPAGKRGQDAKGKKALDEQLDRGLEDTFPASDPVAVTQPPHSPHDRDKP